MRITNMSKKVVCMIHILLLICVLPLVVIAESTQNYNTSLNGGMESELLSFHPNLSTSSDRIMSDNSTKNSDSDMKIKLSAGDTELLITLYDNPTSRDFVSLLPLQINLNDFARAEKIFDLPRRLTTEDGPQGSDPSVGDIAYYSPWGNIAMYYNEAGYADGLVIIGKIESGTENLGTIQPDISVNITKLN
jgi:hypothetical protein